jgi:hypothetical protein
VLVVCSAVVVEVALTVCACVDRHFGTSIAALRLYQALTESGLAS